LRHWGCEIDVYKAEKISSVVPEKGEEGGGNDLRDAIKYAWRRAGR